MDVVLTAVDMLLQCWQVMGRLRFNAEMDAGLAVISAFPMTFAGDPEEAAFIAISRLIRDVLGAEIPDRAACLTQVSEIYDRIGRKAAAQS